MMLLSLSFRVLYNVIFTEVFDHSNWPSKPLANCHLLVDTTACVKKFVGNASQKRRWRRVLLRKTSADSYDIAKKVIKLSRGAFILPIHKLLVRPTARERKTGT